MKTPNWIKNSLLITFSFFVSFFAFEACFYYLNQFQESVWPEKRPITQSPYALKYDESELDRSGLLYIGDFFPNGILLPRKLASGHSIMRTRDGTVVYDAVYGSDEFRRRLMPAQDGRPKKHAIFMGCSWTYGVGVQNNETMPYYFSKYAADFRAYNTGNPGYGINDIFARIRFNREDFWEGIQEKEGVGIYVHALDHVRRLIGAMSRLDNRGHPYLVEDDNGQIVQLDTFQHTRPWLTKVYEFLKQREFVRYFNLDFPKVTAEHWRFFARVVHAVKMAYLTQFPGGKFLVFILPSLTSDPPSPLPPYLKELGIEYVDNSSHFLEDLVGEKTYLNPDSHFTPAANKVLGRLVSEAITANH